MDEKPEDKTRKTVSFTHRQLGIGTGVTAALIAVAPIKEWFFTREEGLAQSKEIAQLRDHSDKQFADLKLFISTNNEEQIRRIERSNDKIVDRIRETDQRAAKSEERLDRRIDSIEIITKPKRFTN